MLMKFAISLLIFYDLYFVNGAWWQGVAVVHNSLCLQTPFRWLHFGEEPSLLCLLMDDKLPSDYGLAVVKNSLTHSDRRHLPDVYVEFWNNSWQQWIFPFISVWISVTSSLFKCSLYERWPQGSRKNTELMIPPPSNTSCLHALPNAVLIQVWPCNSSFLWEQSESQLGRTSQ